MPSYTAVGKEQDPYRIVEGTPLEVFAFTLDVLCIIVNLLTFFGQQFPSLQSKFSNGIRAGCIVMIAYKISFLVFGYTDAPAWVNWVNIMLGYLSVTVIVIVHVELWKGIVELCSMMGLTKLNQRHLLYFQYVIVVVYFVSCLSNELVLLFKLGDYRFAHSPAFYMWNHNLPLFYSVFVELTFLVIYIMQILMVRQLTFKIIQQKMKETKMKHSLQNLSFQILIATFNLLVGFVIFTIGFTTTDSRIGYLFIGMGTSFSCYTPMSHWILGIHLRNAVKEMLAVHSRMLMDLNLTTKGSQATFKLNELH